MTTPTPVDQLAGGGQFPHFDCGEAGQRSVLIDAGRPDSIFDLERWYRAHGDAPSDGSGGDVIAARFAAVGIAAHVWEGDTVAQLASLFGRGFDRCLIAVEADHRGVPTPGSRIGHWLLAYSYDPRAGVVHVMQPVGGLLAAYSVDSIERSQQRYGVSIDQRIGVTPAASVSVGGASMWIGKAVALVPGTADGYTLDGWGGLHPVGSMPPAQGGPYWPSWDIARDLALAPDGSGGIVLDGYGGLHPFAARGTAPTLGGGAPPAYFDGNDVAVRLVVTGWSPVSGYIVDGWGAAHPFGAAPALTGGGYWPQGRP